MHYISPCPSALERKSSLLSRFYRRLVAYMLMRAHPWRTIKFRASSNVRLLIGQDPHTLWLANAVPVRSARMLQHAIKAKQRRVLAVSTVRGIPRKIFAESSRRLHRIGTIEAKLQALVYDIVPPTTAVFACYVIGLRKLPGDSFLSALKQQ